MKSGLHPNPNHIYPIPSLPRLPPNKLKNPNLSPDSPILFPDEQSGVDSPAPQSVNISNIGRGAGTNILDGSFETFGRGGQGGSFSDGMFDTHPRFLLQSSSLTLRECLYHRLGRSR
ncbi:unnamed protein product [Linum trigynum]|uniref:Uncharacterized protein n=1 Tax=Linum trigynum TaxID=586398 RepID=A0AAV2DSF7_9ROSI